MTKRIIALGLILIMALALSACGGNDTVTPVDDIDTHESEVPAETSKKESYVFYSEHAIEIIDGYIAGSYNNMDAGVKLETFISLINDELDGYTNFDMALNCQVMIIDIQAEIIAEGSIDEIKTARNSLDALAHSTSESNQNDMDEANK